MLLRVSDVSLTRRIKIIWMHFVCSLSNALNRSKIFLNVVDLLDRRSKEGEREREIFPERFLLPFFVGSCPGKQNYSHDSTLWNCREAADRASDFYCVSERTNERVRAYMHAYTSSTRNEWQ